MIPRICEESTKLDASLEPIENRDDVILIRDSTDPRKLIFCFSWNDLITSFKNSRRLWTYGRNSKNELWNVEEDPVFKLPILIGENYYINNSTFKYIYQNKFNTIDLVNKKLTKIGSGHGVGMLDKFDAYVHNGYPIHRDSIQNDIIPDKLEIKSIDINLDFIQKDREFRQYGEVEIRVPPRIHAEDMIEENMINDIIENNIENNIAIDISGQNYEQFPPIDEIDYPFIMSIDCSNNLLNELPDLRVFENLKLLDCSYNGLLNFPLLPDTLEKLNISSTNITHIESLPSHLVVLVMNTTHIKFLPILPETLQKLDVSNSNIRRLPELPDSLIDLNCENCQQLKVHRSVYDRFIHAFDREVYIIENDEIDFRGEEIRHLPIIDEGVVKLDCSDNLIEQITNLPSTLKWLNCSSNKLKVLELPPNLEYLNCDLNKLLTLTNIPETLKKLSCEHNNIYLLDDNLTQLDELYADDNRIYKVPQLDIQNEYNLQMRYNDDMTIDRELYYYMRNSFPVDVNIIDVNNPDSYEYKNISVHLEDLKLDVLPYIPEDVRKLYIQNNNIREITNLPDNLEYLLANNNPLSVLNIQNTHISYLNCDNCDFETIPILPHTIVRFDINNNRIREITDLPNSLQIFRCRSRNEIRVKREIYERFRGAFSDNVIII